MTPPCLGSSLLALVPGASRDIIWPLPSKMLFARAPGVVFFFLLAHTSSLETLTQHARSSKASPGRPQVPACWKPVQNEKTKHTGKSIILGFSTEKSHWVADQALLQAQGAPRAQHPPATHLNPAHSPSPCSGMEEALWVHLLQPKRDNCTTPSRIWPTVVSGEINHVGVRMWKGDGKHL